MGLQLGLQMGLQNTYITPPELTPIIRIFAPKRPFLARVDPHNTHKEHTKSILNKTREH